MKLHELIKEARLTSCQVIGDTTGEVSSIVFDTREVKLVSEHAAPLFVAQCGTRVDGHDFIEQAIDRGARFIVCQTLPAPVKQGITYLIVPDSSAALGHLASAFFGHPSRELKLVGVTGTNGKTTIATLLYRLFREMQYPCMLISTIENRINDEIVPASHTTPDAVKINELLARAIEQGCQYAFMEVSSHALCQHRVDGLSFTGGIFTNITHDHLDFHQTFANYIKAKQKFFNLLSKDAFALTNKDDRNGMVMTQNSQARVFTYSLNTLADFKAKILDNSFEGLHLWLQDREAFFKLTGKFNASNLLAIYGTAVLLGLPQDDILIKMSNLDSVSGRFQVSRGAQGQQAIVDYAHTPDALQNVLSTIKDITQNSREIITVVGCGGNRDALKRPVMAETACKYSNTVILTSDNPRNEDPRKILADMEEGIPAGYRHHVIVIENREEAIKVACRLLPPQGVLLVAGKGHENYQEINNTKYHFDDMEIVTKYFTNN
ncbi:MAG: UDP-N-acetylmuramoyl-L-alanyl-D-glutamate--2,6-diaminopimelate ligase [Bacteroidales bacterium]|jgi:UDP-N-acetylmuramoyl-L-alanyl-D-glutamate--2,6-diaminopimelate ligase|nr:UDP-N-acetylmuramoyl-L-alanyl-D-glutamate--2,6-diaminopimelate ligase [Bacteroidales bacterium]